MPRRSGGARPRRHGLTIRGWHPTAGPSGDRPRAGWGSVQARFGRRGNAPRRVRDATERTCAEPLAPVRWISRRSPQTPVRRVAALAEHPDLRVDDGMALTAAVHRHERARGKPRDDDRSDVDRAAVVVHPRRDLDDILARDVGHGVQHVCARIEQEPAARHCRNLPPGPARLRPPVLPDDGVDVEKLAELAARDHPRGRPDLRREAARGNATTTSRPVRSRVAMSASASAAFITMGFSSRTSSPASRHAVAWAAWKTWGVMIATASSCGRQSLDEPVPVGLVRRNGEAAAGERSGCDREVRVGWLAEGGHLGVLAAKHVGEVVSGHEAGPDDADTDQVVWWAWRGILSSATGRRMSVPTEDG